MPRVDVIERANNEISRRIIADPLSSAAGGERPFRSALPFAAWQDRPVGNGLTMAASVGVRRSPVSRLFAVGFVAQVIFPARRRARRATRVSGANVVATPLRKRHELENW